MVWHDMGRLCSIYTGDDRQHSEVILSASVLVHMTSTDIMVWVNESWSERVCLFNLVVIRPNSTVWQCCPSILVIFGNACWQTADRLSCLVSLYTFLVIWESVGKHNHFVIVRILELTMQQQQSLLLVFCGLEKFITSISVTLCCDDNDGDIVSCWH